MTLDKLSSKIFTHDQSILAYWRTIKDIPVPSVDEELELIQKARSGNTDAKTKLAVGHQRFIFAIAKQHAKTVDEIIDYVNEGTMGLLMAIDSYDPTRGFRFITYASYYIRRQMYLYSNFTRNILYSGNKNRYQHKLKEINKSYFDEFGFYPSLETVQEIFEKKYGIVVKNINDLYTIVVDDIEFNEEDDATAPGRKKEFNNATKSSNSYEEQEDIEFIREAIESSLTQLSERESDVIQMLFGLGDYKEPIPTVDVAYKYGITTSAVNNIRLRALDKLRPVLTYKLAC